MFHYENTDDVAQIAVRTKAQLKEGMMTFQYRDRRDWNTAKEPALILPGPYGKTAAER